MIGYRLGMAMRLTMAQYEEMIRNLHCWETSHQKPAPIILLRRAVKSLSLQNRRKRKRALESHRRVNKDFLLSASFRCSWEGPLGCLSPKTCAPPCQRKHGRCLAARTEMRLRYVEGEVSGSLMQKSSSVAVQGRHVLLG